MKMKPIEHLRAIWLAIKLTVGAFALLALFYAYTYYAQWKLYGL